MTVSRKRVAMAAVAGVLALLVMGCALTEAFTPKPDGDLPEEKAPPVETSDGGIVGSSAKVEVFKNTNDGAVRNGPTEQVEFTLDAATRITYIQTYHWNNGAGVAPGTIGLKKADGTVVGTWDAKGEPGQGGVANAYWAVEPDVVLEPGTYVVVDSDPKTQSTNEQMAGRGQTVIQGILEQ